MLSKRIKLIYLILCIGIGLSYPIAREYIIDTPREYLVISNLTLTYYVIFLIVGSSTPYMYLKYTKGPKWLALPLTLVLGGLVMLLMTLGGYKLRI